MTDGGSSLTIAIPTYERGEALVSTIAALLTMTPERTTILVVDQTHKHTTEVTEHLRAFEQAGKIKRLTLSRPSITRAMNCALERAETPYVLFLDDDVIPEPGLAEAYLAAHRLTGADLIAGRVIQPRQEDFVYTPNEFHFASTEPRWIDHFMGGNFSISRAAALRIGGFDENFVRVAYNFEAEFAFRYRRAGGRIYFEPTACVHHLQDPAGGTRTYGRHLTTSRPDHSVGAYYCILRTWVGMKSLRALFWRPIRAVATRHHLRRPWWIPLTLLAELRGMLWAFSLAVRGPRLISSVGIP